MCANLNHRKKMKAEPSRVISRKLTANLELSMILLSITVSSTANNEFI